jgi:hypothetical protein
MNEVARTVAITPGQLEVLKSCEWFGALDSGFQQAVLASSRMIVLAAGERVFLRGDPCDGVYCVISGWPKRRSGLEKLRYSMAERAPTTLGRIPRRYCCTCLCAF